MNIFEVNPHLTSYVAKYMDKTGVDFKSACDALDIYPLEDIETNDMELN